MVLQDALDSPHSIVSRSFVTIVALHAIIWGEVVLLHRVALMRNILTLITTQQHHSFLSKNQRNVIHYISVHALLQAAY